MQRAPILDAIRIVRAARPLLGHRLRVVAVAGVFVLSCVAAFAQVVCTGFVATESGTAYWPLSASDPCGEFTTIYEGYGAPRDVVSCTRNGNDYAVTVINGSGVSVNNWTLVGTGCTGEPGGGEPGTSCGSVQMVPPDFLNLSPEDGAQLGFAVAGVWALAWAFRALAAAFQDRRDPDTD